jgi:hypothetical protein
VSTKNQQVKVVAIVELVEVTSDLRLRFKHEGKSYTSSRIVSHLIEGEKQTFTTASGSTYICVVTEKTLLEKTLQTVSAAERAGMITSNVRDFLVGAYSTVKTASCVTYRVVRSMVEGAVAGYKASK